MFDEDEYIHEYIFSGSLPENASTYVKREADDELYEALQQGKFCYVLNSRQSGKSSLRLRTMSRLSQAGVECASIDLSSINVQGATQENWYADLITILTNNFVLDIDSKNLRIQNQSNSPLMRFTLFLEKHLLFEIEENIVIFIDEIDSVLSLNFPTDDFFAFIRACYNQRVDNPAYNRLTFCLLGVASPGNLIQDKQRTPFNIGKAISLKGFQLDETEPLIKGLQGQFSDPQTVMEEILDWTGGQPFLTQKLCQFMLEESEQEHPRTVEEVVKSRIIESWESQDEPEHLRTIRSRILRNEERAGYLLELYQQIRCSEVESIITANNTIEQSELLLSGLVAKREGKLRVYNRIYQEVFNQNWVETQLKNLRPYSESFKFWVASDFKNESRLLRGQALADAEKWAKGKNLSYQDKQFLAASREKEIQEKIAAEEQASQLERERKDKEAAEQRNKVLSEANKKAKRRIRNGTVVLILALLAAVSLGVFAARKGYEALEAEQNADKAKEEVKLAKEQVTVEQQKVQQATKKAEEEREKVKALQKQAQKAKEKAEIEQHKAKQAEKNASDAKRKAIEARKEAQKAQQNADNASQKAIKARQQAKSEQRKAKEAQKNAELASRTAQAAKQEADNLQNQLNSAKEDFKIVKKDVETVQDLSKLAGELRNKNLIYYSNEALRQAGLSFRVDDHNLKQAMLLASMAQAYQQLKQPDEVQSNLDESLKYLNQKRNISSPQGWQIKAIVKGMQGNLIKEKNKSQAILAYQEAYNILKNYPLKTNPFADNQIITAVNIESVHRGLLELKPNKPKVWDSLKEHYYAKLENSLQRKNWEEADLTTDRLMLFIANREYLFLNVSDINKFPCPDLKRMDKLWVQNSDGHFGFSVQKKIWVNTGNRLGIRNWNKSDEQNYLRFAAAIGWYNIPKGDDINTSGWMSYRDFIRRVEQNYRHPGVRGGLPHGDTHGWLVNQRVFLGTLGGERGMVARMYSFLAVRLVKCNL